MSLPFQEIKLSDNTFIREFYQETDWLIQLDDEIPKKIEGQIFIPMGIYHRLIKGSGDLKIKLQKLT